MSRSEGRTPAIVGIFGVAVKAWWDDDALRLGAALAYYTLFAIAPVLLVAIGVAGLAFNTDAVRGEIVNQLDHLRHRSSRCSTAFCLTCLSAGVMSPPVHLSPPCSSQSGNS